MKISLAAARVNAGLTQEQVAEKIEVSKNTLISWEKGRTVPKIAYFEMLCRLYNISKDSIFFPDDLTRC